MKLNNDIIERAKKIWGDDWKRIVEKYEEKEEKYELFPQKIKEQMGTPTEQFIRLLEGREAAREWELEVVNTIIPKEKLKDGVHYVAMEGTDNLCRHVKEARWDEKEGMFWYWRSKFGYTFEDTMHHFADVVNGELAGFTPMCEKDK